VIMDSGVIMEFSVIMDFTEQADANRPPVTTPGNDH